MQAVTTPDDPIVVGCIVVKRSQSMLPLNEMKPLAEFSSYHIAVLAVKLLRRNTEWLRAAELMLDDEDYLTIQVLARKLKIRTAKVFKSTSDQLFSKVETGIGSEVKLEDLL